jgi:hypothetical protein
MTGRGWVLFGVKQSPNAGSKLHPQELSQFASVHDRTSQPILSQTRFQNTLSESHLPISKRRIVYVIGAGLSAGLDFPTINDLLPKLWKRPSFRGVATDIEKIIQFHHPEFDVSQKRTYPTIERLLSEMKANAELFNSTRPAAGRFTSEQLDQQRSILLQEIASWFHELKKNAIASNPSWLVSLVDAIKTDEATIISFNWDLVLDDLLFGKELDKTSYGLGRPRGGPRLIKPHGSLNWYQGDTAEPLSESKKFKLAGAGANQVYAFRPMRAPHSKAGRVYMPLIVPPVYSKQFDGPLFQRLWQEVVSALSTATEVRFLGYSLAEADFHARFVLRCGFYNQEHGEIKPSSSRATATGRARIIVVDPSSEPLERIRGAVGWDCEFHKMTISEWIENDGLKR